jgi:hypothetical protein
MGGMTMNVNNGTTTPSDTRVTSGGSGMIDPPGKSELAREWRTIQPGETVSYDLTGPGPWKVEFRLRKGGRRRIFSEIVQTPHDLVELIEAGDDVGVRITRPRLSASR